MNDLYLMNKLNRLIRWQGQEYKFIRYKKDKYNENTNEFVSVNLKGIFHESSNKFINVKFNDGATIESKDNFYVTCLFKDVSIINKEDILELGNRKFKVNGIKNLSNLSIIAMISLDEMK